MTQKLTFRSHLYLGDSINTKDLPKLKRQLMKRPLLNDVFLLTLSSNPKDQLEFYHCRQLALSYFHRNHPVIYGIAGSYSEAIALVVKIAEECFRTRNDCSLREYLTCKDI